MPSPSGDDDDGSTPTGSNPPPGQGIVRVASTTSGRVVTAHVDRSHDYEVSVERAWFVAARLGSARHTLSGSFRRGSFRPSHAVTCHSVT